MRKRPPPPNSRVAQKFQIMPKRPPSPNSRVTAKFQIRRKRPPPPNSGVAPKSKNSANTSISSKVPNAYVPEHQIRRKRTPSVKPGSWMIFQRSEIVFNLTGKNNIQTSQLQQSQLNNPTTRPVNNCGPVCAFTLLRANQTRPIAANPAGNHLMPASCA